MTYQEIVWCAIAGVLLCAFIFRAIKRSCAECRKHEPRHIFEIGKDKDIFYIPGDIDDEDDYEDM